MKKIFPHSKTAALLCAAGALSLTSMQAMAADSGTLTMKANFISSTCTLVIGKTANGITSATNTQTLNLGNVASPTGTQPAGSNFGPVSKVSFDLKDPADNTKPCVVLGKSNWSITTSVAALDFVSAGGVTHLKNKKTDADGTDALVTLFGTIGTNAISTPLNLSTGTVTLFTVPFSSAQSGYLHAKFAIPASGTGAKSGVFQYTMPVTVAYN